LLEWRDTGNVHVSDAGPKECGEFWDEETTTGGGLPRVKETPVALSACETRFGGNVFLLDEWILRGRSMVLASLEKQSEA